MMTNLKRQDLFHVCTLLAELSLIINAGVSYFKEKYNFAKTHCVRNYQDAYLTSDVNMAIITSL